MGREEREKPSALGRGPGWPDPGQLAPCALGQKERAVGDLRAAGQEKEGQYNPPPTLTLEGPPYRAPLIQKTERVLAKRVLAPCIFLLDYNSFNHGKIYAR